MQIFLLKYYACVSTGASTSSFINVTLLCCLKCPHDFPLSNKSLASFIFAAKRGDPPRSGWFSAIILLWASWKKLYNLWTFLCLLRQSWLPLTEWCKAHLCPILGMWHLKIDILKYPNAWLSCLWVGIDPSMYRPGTSWISCRLATVLHGS